MSSHEKEVVQGQHFQAGAKWARFLSMLKNQRIATPEAPKATIRRR